MKLYQHCKKALTLILVFTIHATIVAQKEKTDTIFLKNGNMLFGRIVMYVPSESLKINTSEGIFFFQNTDILDIRIHTFHNYQSGFNVSHEIEVKPATIETADLSNAKVIKIKSENYSGFGSNELRNNIIILEFGLGMTGYQFKTSINRRTNNNSIGIVYGYRDISGYSFNNVLIAFRNYKKTKSANLSSFAVDFGIGIPLIWGLSAPSLILNPSYLYGIKFGEKSYFTLGCNLNLQSGIGEIDLGLSAGILF